ncbi:MAG: DUF3067 domain-containing protein [Cyanobacteria bacterium QS_8_64_29]|nr:MAG: DUF3067 domain-containing protein [Cyanobacteria bacterium QS_8_64_29]
MTGQELQQLLLDKWGRSYDIRLRRTPARIFVQIMWRYLEQASFPLDETEYRAHLAELARYLDGMGATAQVREAIRQTRRRPRVGRAVSIPIELGERASEWLVEPDSPS